MRRSAFGSLLLLLVACAPGFNPFRKIEKPRVIGAQLDVTTDIGRTTPAPGEEARLTLIVADDGPKVGRTYAMVVCVPGTSNLDIVFCDSTTTFVDAELVTALPGPADPKPDPSITFTVPDATTLGNATELWVMGAVCNGGVVKDLLSDPPVYGHAYDPCQPDPTADPTPVGQLINTRIRLERDPIDRNHRPTYMSITLDDPSTPGTIEAWTAVAPDDAPSTGCAGMGYPELPAFVADPNDELAGTFAFAATAMDTDREVYFDALTSTQVTEDLFARTFLTDGKFDAPYDAITDGDPVAALRYTPPPPNEVDPSGTLVRFWFELFDSRDAATWVPRAVCVVK